MSRRFPESSPDIIASDSEKSGSHPKVIPGIATDLFAIPYRPAYGINVALDEILQNKGVLYDPEIVNLCQSSLGRKGLNWNKKMFLSMLPFEP